MKKALEMVILRAPDGCNEVASGDETYTVRNGIVSVPEPLVAQLIGSHGFARVMVNAQQPEQRKVLALKK